MAAITCEVVLPSLQLQGRVRQVDANAIATAFQVFATTVNAAFGQLVMAPNLIEVRDVRDDLAPPERRKG